MSVEILTILYVYFIQAKIKQNFFFFVLYGLNGDTNLGRILKVAYLINLQIILITQKLDCLYFFCKWQLNLHRQIYVIASKSTQTLDLTKRRESSNYPGVFTNSTSVGKPQEDVQ